MATKPAPAHHEEAYVSVMRGLNRLDLHQHSHVPCDLVLIGDHAFPLAMNSRGQVLMAASLFGKGRIVVLGHENYISTFPGLVHNALNWLHGSGSNKPLVEIHQGSKAVADNLSSSSFQVKVVSRFRENPEVSVYVTDAYSVGPHVRELVEHLKVGGGVLIAGQAWQWAKENPKQNTLLGFPGNKVSSVAGIYFSEHQGELEPLDVHPQIPSSWLAVAIEKDFKEDLEFLLKDVSEFDISGGSLASEVLVHGPLAFPIGTNEHGRTFLAGAYYGQGRVIVITHEGFLGRQQLGTFWNNALHWLDEGRKGVVGVHPQLGAAYNLFSKSGLKCVKTDFKKDLSVFVTKSYGDAHMKEILEFVAEGGGLIMGGHAWYWAQTHHGHNPLTEYPGNHILNNMGLSVLGNTLKGGCFKALDPGNAMKDGYHFRQLLRRFAGHVTLGEKLTDHDEKCLKRLGQDCANYLHMRANDCSSYTQVVSSLTDILRKTGIPQVCSSCPVKKTKDHLLLNVGAELYKVCPDPDALLPYLIKDNPLLPVVYNHKITIDVSTGGGEEWLSTGLYLSPGMKTYIAIPPEINNKGWAVQIGCQTDNLCNLNELKRAPCVHERFPVNKDMMLVHNLWGGLIYLVAPSKTQVKGPEVIVQIAIPAPYYKSGVTSPSDWSLLRTAPSPWAELEFENIILTIPSSAVRGLDKPEEVAALWDEMMRAIADLAVIPRKFTRKERFVTDVQISHGWMHAGYPVMMQSPVASELVDPKKIRSSGIWGPIHELGHNQQRGCWEFPSHTTECTCNLWSVYVHEEVLGISRDKAHGTLKQQTRKSRTQNYVKGGRNLKDWHMWVALETYLQLQEEFGWDAFKKVFASYHNMKNFPKNNKDKMNLYAVTFSQTVEKNLCDFFKAWGWSLEPATEEKLSSLPPWKNHPMVQYG